MVAAPVRTHAFAFLCPGYCRLVDLVLKDIPDSVAISFLDDGVIHSAEVEDHIRNVRTVLAAYRDAGLKLAVKKCNFFADEITYLGHVLNEKGIRPIDSYVDAIKKWPLSRYKTEARAFLGVTGYYRQHIPDYAKSAYAQKQQHTLAPLMYEAFAFL